MNEIRDLRDMPASVSYTIRRLRSGGLPRETPRGCGSGEATGEGGAAPRVPHGLMIPAASRPGQVEPVARSTPLDVAPRGAMRKIGPRPDQSRSARTKQPDGTSIQPIRVEDGRCSLVLDGRLSLPEGGRAAGYIATHADPGIRHHPHLH